MPKKRHRAQFSKPQSTAPPSLQSSGLRRDPLGPHDARQPRSVNQLLADLRRVQQQQQLHHHHHPSGVLQAGGHSVPPDIRHILQLPETPAPAPRRPARLDPRGRRLPPGPAPPRSWLSMLTRAPQQGGSNAVSKFERRDLPDAYNPARKGLVAMLLRKMAVDWDFQKEYNGPYLASMPSHLRVALISHIGLWQEAGVSSADLRVLLLPPAADDDDDDESPAILEATNEDVLHLDLGGSLGRSIRVQELSDLLFPSTTEGSDDVQDSWDAPDSSPIRRPLLPNLSHLSLELKPNLARSVSWKQLLSFSSHLPTLTHLSLAYWPEPSLTPNAKYASVVTQQGLTIQYGGTGPYSHSLDNDWSEAVMVLRKLAKNLYGLEYLDLTGCSAWFPALMHRADHDEVDWVGDWGKMTTLVLRSGGNDGENPAPGDITRSVNNISTASMIEKRIRTSRAGRGRFITVEKDRMPDSSSHLSG